MTKENLKKSEIERYFARLDKDRQFEQLDLDLK